MPVPRDATWGALAVLAGAVFATWPRAASASAAPGQPAGSTAPSQVPTSVTPAEPPVGTETPSPTAASEGSATGGHTRGDDDDTDDAHRAYARRARPAPTEASVAEAARNGCWSTPHRGRHVVGPPRRGRCFDAESVELLRLGVGVQTINLAQSRFGTSFTSGTSGEYHVSATGASIGAVRPMFWSVEIQVAAFVPVRFLVISPFVGFGGADRDASVPGTGSLTLGGLWMFDAGAAVSAHVRFGAVGVRLGVALGVRNVWSEVTNVNLPCRNTGGCHPSMDSLDFFVQPRVALEIPLGHEFALGAQGSLEVYPAPGFGAQAYFAWHTLGFEEAVNATGPMDDVWAERARHAGRGD
jgi:hypothetical protein